MLFVAISGVTEAAGPGNGKGQAKGKAKGHDKTEETVSSNDSGSSSDSSSSNSDSGPSGNGNTGSSKTRKGLDDTQMNQNIYQEGNTLSYHVSNRHAGENTIIVKKPGKNGEIVFQTTVMVGEDGTLNVELLDIPEDWVGVYQVQIWDGKGMKNDNINIKRPHVSNREDLPTSEPELESGDTNEPDDATKVVTSSNNSGDCTTVVYHASNPEVTVVEFFKVEHADDPWNHEGERLGESRVDTEGAVTAIFAGGEVFVVFEYDETTGAYNYRGTGRVVAEGEYDGLVHVWSDGDAESILFNILAWTPYGAAK